MKIFLYTSNIVVTILTTFNNKYKRFLSHRNERIDVLPIKKKCSKKIYADK